MKINLNNYENESSIEITTENKDDFIFILRGIPCKLVEDNRLVGHMISDDYKILLVSFDGEVVEEFYTMDLSSLVCENKIGIFKSISDGVLVKCPECGGVNWKHFLGCSVWHHNNK